MGGLYVQNVTKKTKEIFLFPIMTKKNTTKYASVVEKWSVLLSGKVMHRALVKAGWGHLPVM